MYEFKEYCACGCLDGEKEDGGQEISCSIHLTKSHMLLEMQMMKSIMQKLAGKVRKAFNGKFFDRNRLQYERGSQAANAFTLYLGLVPDEAEKGVLDNLVEDVVVKRDRHLTTGNLCTKYLMEVLTDKGRNDVAWLLATQMNYPSWGYMIANGATTI